MSEALPTPAHLTAPRTDIGVAWFIKRTIMAVLIMCVSVGGGAWLLHSSIDPTPEANAAAVTTSAQELGPTGAISSR